MPGHAACGMMADVQETAASSHSAETPIKATAECVAAGRGLSSPGSQTAWHHRQHERNARRSLQLQCLHADDAGPPGRLLEQRSVAGRTPSVRSRGGREATGILASSPAAGDHCCKRPCCDHQNNPQCSLPTSCWRHKRCSDSCTRKKLLHCGHGITLRNTPSYVAGFGLLQAQSIARAAPRRSAPAALLPHAARGTRLREPLRAPPERSAHTEHLLNLPTEAMLDASPQQQGNVGRVSTSCSASAQQER